MPKKEGLGLGGAAGPPQAEVKSFGKGGPTASLVRSYCQLGGLGSIIRVKCKYIDEAIPFLLPVLTLLVSNYHVEN